MYRLHIQYKGQVMEMESDKEILRVGVEDKDTPYSPGWKAKYYFIKGNEDNNYALTTDPKTNEGVLTVIKVHFGIPRLKNSGTTRTFVQPNSELCGAFADIAIH